MNDIEQRKALDYLKRAQRELSLLYSYAIMNGVPECDNPLHMEIYYFINEIEQY